MSNLIIDGVEYNSENLMIMFLQVLDDVGLFLLNESDKFLQDTLFEEFDFDMYGSWQDEKLDILVKSGKITNEIKQKFQMMRDISESLIQNNVGRDKDSIALNAKTIRESKEWMQVFTFSDEIKALLKK